MTEAKKQHFSGPCSIYVEPGHEYIFCGCGQTDMPPFCKQASSFCVTKQITYKTQKARNILVCQCTKSKHMPLCDGEHSKLLKK